jgi:hypothetical protein
MTKTMIGATAQGTLTTKNAATDLPVTVCCCGSRPKH